MENLRLSGKISFKLDSNSSVHKNVRSQGGGGLSSADIFRKREVL